MPESATETVSAAGNAGKTWKIVVRFAHDEPLIGILISEGPKILKVRHVYGMGWRAALADEEENPSQYGQNWYRGSCEILDPIFDGVEIAAAEELAVEHERIIERQRGELEVWRAEYRKKVAALFPSRKEA